MFDVLCSSFKTNPYGINLTCEYLQNNSALTAINPEPLSADLCGGLNLEPLQHNKVQKWILHHFQMNNTRASA
jgi:hypothetical protein